MKRLILEKYGIEELKLTDFSGFTPTEYQILVRNKASSINPFDKSIVTGALKEIIPLGFPFVPGGDFSGIVKSVGKNVKSYKKGDEIYGTASILLGGSGALADELITLTSNVAPKPVTIGFEESASFVLVGVSAYQALVENMKLEKGQKILIHGGAGGIGHVAIQLAASLGAYVSTTASKEDEEFVKGLGSIDVIDYKAQEFNNILKEYDAVFDTIGGETTNKSFEVLRKGGVLVSMKGQPDQGLAEKYEVIAISQNTKVTEERLKKITALIDQKKIKVHIEQTFPLEKTKAAFEYLDKQSPRGKIAIGI